MSSNRTQPDFAPIQDHIERFRLERAARAGTAAAELAHGFTRALGSAFKHLGQHLERGYVAELDRRAVEADAFLRRSAQRY